MIRVTAGKAANGKTCSVAWHFSSPFGPPCAKPPLPLPPPLPLIGSHLAGCWLQGGQAKEGGRAAGAGGGREGVHSSHSPQPQWGRGGWCKYCKSKLDWCDQRGVRLRERQEEEVEEEEKEEEEGKAAEGFNEPRGGGGGGGVDGSSLRLPLGPTCSQQTAGAPAALAGPAALDRRTPG